MLNFHPIIQWQELPNVHHTLYLLNLLHPKTVQNVLVHREMGSPATLVFEHFRPDFHTLFNFLSLGFHGLYLMNNFSCQGSSMPYNEVHQNPLQSPSSSWISDTGVKCTNIHVTSAVGKGWKEWRWAARCHIMERNHAIQNVLKETRVSETLPSLFLSSQVIFWVLLSCSPCAKTLNTTHTHTHTHT